MARTVGFIIVAIALASGVAADNTAEEVQRWRCGDDIDTCFFSTCPVTLTGNTRDGTGEVQFSGTVTQTRFKVQGLELRWDWCPHHAKGTYDCTLVISANGKGRYFNFQGQERAKPTDFFECYSN